MLFDFNSLYEPFNYSYKSLLNENTPKTHIDEHDDSYSISLVVPGVERKHVTITQERDHIIVENSHEGEFTHPFKRKFTFPENVKASKIHSKLDHGILHITLPKHSKHIHKQRLIDIG